MKKTLLVICGTILSFSLFAQAPSYKNFELEFLRIGYAGGGTVGQSGGVALGAEIRFNLTDKISLGLATDGYVSGDDFAETSVDIGVAVSTMLFGDYYFKGDSPNRFFAGLGAGFVRDASFTANTDGMVSNFVAAPSGFGVAPRIGYELGHLRLQAVYNLPFAEGRDGFFGVTAGIVLWGGYKG